MLVSVVGTTSTPLPVRYVIVHYLLEGIYIYIQCLSYRGGLSVNKHAHINQLSVKSANLLTGSLSDIQPWLAHSVLAERPDRISYQVSVPLPVRYAV
jgi:hypothetical protein